MEGIDVKLKYSNIGKLDVCTYSDDTVQLTYIPNPDEFNHYHIDMDFSEAKKLRNWLNKVLEKK